MVSSTVNDTGDVKLPPGKYNLVGWDVDTTGRLLIDEMCQIAAYSPQTSFAQYVMPYRSLNFAAVHRHNIRVYSTSRYRMLKDSKTGKILKTKSEISALVSFLEWLEKVGGKEGDGIILVSHEVRKIAAPLLLEGLRRYNLLERFTAVVKGFANGYNLAELKCAKTVLTFSLRTLSRVLLDKNEELDSAVHRARLAFEVIQHLCCGEDRPENGQGSGDGSDIPEKVVMDTILEYTKPIAAEEKELASLKVVLERKNSLRPMFSSLLGLNRRENIRANTLRQLLAEAGVNLEDLTTAYAQNGKESIETLLTSKVTKATTKEIEELMKIIESHFDPKSRPSAEIKSDTKKDDVVASSGEGTESSSPDTTTSSPVKAVPTSSDDIPSPDIDSTSTSPKKTTILTEQSVTSLPESTAS